MISGQRAAQTQDVGRQVTAGIVAVMSVLNNRELYCAGETATFSGAKRANDGRFDGGLTAGLAVTRRRLKRRWNCRKW